MDLTTEESNTDPTDATLPDVDEIRGMMPSFHVWQEAQHTLKFERAAATVARERALAAAGRKHWPLLFGLCAVIAIALLLERSGGGGVVVPTVATPADQLPWRTVRSPSHSFRVSLPAESESKKVVAAAGTGEQVEARMEHITIAVSAFAVAGPSQGQSLIDPIFAERADALDAQRDPVRQGRLAHGLVLRGDLAHDHGHRHGARDHRRRHALRDRDPRRRRDPPHEADLRPGRGQLHPRRLIEVRRSARSWLADLR